MPNPHPSLAAADALPTRYGHATAPFAVSRPVELDGTAYATFLMLEPDPTTGRLTPRTAPVLADATLRQMEGVGRPDPTNGYRAPLEARPFLPGGEPGAPSRVGPPVTDVRLLERLGAKAAQEYRAEVDARDAALLARARVGPAPTPVAPTARVAEASTPAAGGDALDALVPTGEGRRMTAATVRRPTPLWTPVVSPTRPTPASIVGG